MPVANKESIEDVYKPLLSKQGSMGLLKEDYLFTEEST